MESRPPLKTKHMSSSDGPPIVTKSNMEPAKESNPSFPFPASWRYLRPCNQVELSDLGSRENKWVADQLSSHWLFGSQGSLNFPFLGPTKVPVSMDTSSKLQLVKGKSSEPSYQHGSKGLPAHETRYHIHLLNKMGLLKGCIPQPPGLPVDPPNQLLQ